MKPPLIQAVARYKLLICVTIRPMCQLKSGARSCVSAWEVAQPQRVVSNRAGMTSLRTGSSRKDGSKPGIVLLAGPTTSITRAFQLPDRQGIK